MTKTFSRTSPGQPGPGNPPTRRRWLAADAALVAAALLPATARAQSDWPRRPIRLVVPFPPGGSSDTLGRVFAERLRAELDATVVVENRPGGTTQVGTEIVSRADPDGYTLLQGSATAFAVLPNLRRVPYDPANGFEAVGGVAEYVAIVTVRKELGIATLAELIELAHREPGKLTYGSAGLASVGHLSGEILKREARIDMLHVPFRGSGELVPALIGGQIDLFIDGVGLGAATSGRAVPLAAFSEFRHPALPELPSLAEAGVETELPTGGWGVMVPKGTPPEIVGRLSEAAEKVARDPGTAEELLRAGIVARWIPPEVYRKRLEDARAFYAEFLPSIGLTRTE
ncbi:MAG TPA: tripartite tricarboxylate transporter substrate binding protein [Burkholderiaceae bacterium]|nr:tripartite tricarboxylate transporter substrate binding protein [Burkholderiaceae bacterium]